MAVIRIKDSQYKQLKQMKVHPDEKIWRIFDRILKENKKKLKWR